MGETRAEFLERAEREEAAAAQRTGTAHGRRLPVRDHDSPTERPGHQNKGRGEKGGRATNPHHHAQD